jgi:hypothetical protein
MADLSVTTLDKDTGFVTFRFVRGRLTPVRGRAQLAQQFVVNFLKTPGQEKAAPDLGGGIRNINGTVRTNEGLRSAAMGAAIVVDNQMRLAISKNRTIRQKTEILETAAVVSTDLSIGTTGQLEAKIVIAVTSGAGNPLVLGINAGNISL